MDCRYVILIQDLRLFTYYELKDHPLNDDLGSIFSVLKQWPKHLKSNR